MKKSILRIISFMIILTICLWQLNNIFAPKYGDGIYSVTMFYEQENNSIDVLFLGSSHAFENINTGTLWDEYGLASYIMGGSVQSLWNTYYYLEEALKTQHPKLIVLDAFSTTFIDNYLWDANIIKNTFGLRWSSTKINAIKTSVPQELWWDYFLEYCQYHTRYKQIDKSDFLPNQDDRLYDNWKGFGCNMVTDPIECPDVTAVTERTELLSKSEKYYRKIIELAQSNNIPIYIIIAPYGGITEDDQKVFNKAADIAAEYNVPFTNYNLCIEKTNIDFLDDAADYEHLNYKGNQKFSVALGKDIVGQFNVPDRRNDSNYESWEEHAKYIQETIYNQAFRDCPDLSQLFSMINNPNYLCFFSIDGQCDVSDSYTQEYLNALGIHNANSQGVWYNNVGQTIWNSTTDNNDFYLDVNRHDIYLKSAGSNPDAHNIINIDNQEYKTIDDGINIVIFDTLTEKVVDSFGLNSKSKFVLVRNDSNENGEQ